MIALSLHCFIHSFSLHLPWMYIETVPSDGEMDQEKATTCSMEEVEVLGHLGRSPLARLEGMGDQDSNLLTRVMSPHRGGSQHSSRNENLQAYNYIRSRCRTRSAAGVQGPVIACHKFCRDGQAEYINSQTMGKCERVSEPESGATIRGTMTAERDSNDSSQNQSLPKSVQNEKQIYERNTESYTSRNVRNKKTKIISGF